MFFYLKSSLTSSDYFLGLFRITRAATTPGTHPQIVRINTIKTDPHPLSMTAKGGKRIASNTRRILMLTKLRL